MLSAVIRDYFFQIVLCLGIIISQNALFRSSHPEVFICCMFSEHISLRTPLSDCFWNINLSWSTCYNCCQTLQWPLHDLLCNSEEVNFLVISQFNPILTRPFLGFIRCLKKLKKLHSMRCILQMRESDFAKNALVIELLEDGKLKNWYTKPSIIVDVIYLFVKWSGDHQNIITLPRYFQQ